MAIKPTALYYALATDLQAESLHADLVKRMVEGGATHPEVQRMLNQWDYFAGSSPREVQCQRLLQSIFKKYNASKGTTAEQDTTALNKFLAVNNRLSSWVYAPNTSADEELMGSLRDTLWHFWNPQGLPLVSNLLAILDRGKTGPGASIGARGTDFYTKMFASPLTYTSAELLATYEWWTSENPTSSHAEILRQSMITDPPPTSENRLSFVPKDDNTSRTIATEPSLNMYFQLGLGDILTQRLRTFFGLDLTDQQFWNQEAARIGSELGDSYVTIDLSSASDSLGLKLLDWLLPADFNRLLKKLRSPRGLLPDGSVVDYNMMSTMGNGYTFPLQTVLFSSIVVAAIKSFGLTPEGPRYAVFPAEGKRGKLAAKRLSAGPASWGVFGDDIVCHYLVHRRVLRLLELCGFVVNSDKTFVVGHFRESCGHDYYRGHDVRGFFIKDPLSSCAALNVAINGLISWSYKTGIPLPETGKLLCRELGEKGWVYPVPLDESPDAGIRMPTFVLDHLGLTLKRGKNRAFMYERLVASPKQLRIGDGFIAVPKGSYGRIYNPAGLLLAFIRGNVRSGRISIRQSDVRYRVKRCVTPNWDYVPPVSDMIRHAGDRFRISRLEILSGVFLDSLREFL